MDDPKKRKRRGPYGRKKHVENEELEELTLSTRGMDDDLTLTSIDDVSCDDFVDLRQETAKLAAERDKGKPVQTLVSLPQERVSQTHQHYKSPNIPRGQMNPRPSFSTPSRHGMTMMQDRPESTTNSGTTMQRGVPISNQLAPQPAQGVAQIAGRKIIWRGQLTWKDSKSSDAVASRRLLQCELSVSLNSAGVDTSYWPAELKMQFLHSKYLSSPYLQQLLKNSYKMACHFTNPNVEGLNALLKALETEFTGIAEFPSGSEVQIFFITLIKGCKLSLMGLIPYNQKAVKEELQRISFEITKQRNMTQTMLQQKHTMTQAMLQQEQAIRQTKLQQEQENTVALQQRQQANTKTMQQQQQANTYPMQQQQQANTQTMQQQQQSAAHTKLESKQTTTQTKLQQEQTTTQTQPQYKQTTTQTRPQCKKKWTQTKLQRKQKATQTNIQHKQAGTQTEPIVKMLDNKALCKLPVESILEELSCAICLDPFTDPVTLPCIHSFCKKCVKDIFTAGRGSLQCPECRMDINLGEKGLDGLPKNFTIAKLVEKCKEIPKEAKVCSVCDSSPPNTAVKSCKQCEISYCQQCLTVLHPNRGAFMRHELIDEVSVQDDGPSPAKKCCREESCLTRWTIDSFIQ